MLIGNTDFIYLVDESDKNEIRIINMVGGSSKNKLVGTSASEDISKQIGVNAGA